MEASATTSVAPPQEQDCFQTKLWRESVEDCVEGWVVEVKVKDKKSWASSLVCSPERVNL
jgi:hypothetical protein